LSLGEVVRSFRRDTLLDRFEDTGLRHVTETPNCRRVEAEPRGQKVGVNEAADLGPLVPLLDGV
jgi:hypothetical protein